MNKFTSVALVLALLFIGCDEDIENKYARNRIENSTVVTNTGTQQKHIEAPLNPELLLSKQVAFENIRIIPILSGGKNSPLNRLGSRYKTLHEGLEAKTLLVSEHGNPSANNNSRSRRQRNARESNQQIQSSTLNGTLLGGRSNSAISQNRTNESERHYDSPEVNSLSVENKGEDTIIIMAGELVKGGDQDRIVAEDMLVMPHSGKKSLPVYCVEPHRWGHEGNHSSSSTFNLTNNFAASSVRKMAMVNKDQNAVWNSVGEITKTHAASTNTGTYNAIESSKSYADKKKSYLLMIEKLFPKSDRVVGVLVLDKVGNTIACDIFNSHELFKKVFQSLIHGYVTEVITYNSVPPTQGIQPFGKKFKQIKNEFNEKIKRKENHFLIYREQVIHYSRF